MSHEFINSLFNAAEIKVAENLAQNDTHILNLLKTAKKDSSPLLNTVITELLSKLKDLNKNPSKSAPQAHYFQSQITHQLAKVCLSIRQIESQGQFSLSNRCKNKLSTLCSIYQLYAGTDIYAKSDRLDKIFAYLIKPNAIHKEYDPIYVLFKKIFDTLDFNYSHHFMQLVSIKNAREFSAWKEKIKHLQPNIDTVQWEHLKSMQADNSLYLPCLSLLQATAQKPEFSSATYTAYLAWKMLPASQTAHLPNSLVTASNTIANSK